MLDYPCPRCNPRYDFQRIQEGFMPRREQVRTSRRDLLAGGAAFVLFQLGLALAIEDWWPQFRDPYYAYRAARLLRQVRAKPRPFIVLALGSSQVQDGLMPAVLDQTATQRLGRPVKAFNFGVPGAGPLVNLLNYRRLETAGFRPELLLLEVVPICWTEEGNSPVLSRLTADRLERHEVAFVGQYGLSAREWTRDWWEVSLLPTHGHRFALLARLAPDLVPASSRLDWARHVDDSGWQEPLVRTVSPEQRCRAVTQACAKYRACLARFQANPSACRALEDLLERCRRHAVPVVLLWMPESTAIRGCYPPAVETRIHRYLETLRRRYAAPLLNARTWVADDDFLDGRHLLVGGARVFTERLAKELRFPPVESAERKYTVHETIPFHP